MEDFINKKLGELPIRKDLQTIDKSALLIPYDFNSLHPSAQADKNITWPAIQTAYLFENYMNDARFARYLIMVGRMN